MNRRRFILGGGLIATSPFMARRRADKRAGRRPGNPEDAAVAVE